MPRACPAAACAAALIAVSPFAAGDADVGQPFRRIETAAFVLGFDPVTQRLLSLAPRNGADGGDFDFLPVDRYVQRSGKGYYHLGDLDLRLREGGETAWRDCSTAERSVGVEPILGESGVLLAGAFGDGLDCGLAVERRWLADGDALILRFTLRNAGVRPVEVGGLGIPMVFNNIITDRSLEEAHARASFTDPYIGLDAGYVQVTRLNGRGPVLLVLPESGTPLEAWKPVLDETGADSSPLIFNDPTPRGITFEGFHAWMAASKGFAEFEWRDAEQWNPPTSFTIPAAGRRDVGLRFVTAPSIRAIEDKLADEGRPVAVGIPGYVLPTDLPGDLFLKSQSPVESFDVHPPGSLDVEKAGGVGGWQRFRVAGRAWGRSRLDLRYEDGTRQAVHYFVIKPAAEAVADLGRFLFDEQWFDDAGDPFGRAPSVMSYDREKDAVILQEQRAWIAGLSDEGGAGSWLAAIMKQLGRPEASELEKFERFVTETLVGGLQVESGDGRFGVRRSLFHYDPEAMPDVRYDPDRDWSLWSAWDRDHAQSLDRSFNYVHVTAAHWVLYRLARFREGLVRAHDWRWYLLRAYETAMAMVRLAPHYSQFGQMEGSVHVEILRALKREGMEREARALEAVMQGRAVHWRNEAFPFASEMPWDSTGQEEVHAWMRWFGDHDKAKITREVILGYDPLIPHWGYNGSARRYWDFQYAGKRMRIERQLHHYGSSNNAIPLFDGFRQDPDDIHLLRVAYGGLMGVLTNIDRDGFGSAAFHSFPDALRFDAYSGDYGSGFFGHAFATASWLLEHSQFGWIAFGGVVEEENGVISMKPKDSFRTRVFVAPAGLWVTLDAGRFERVEYDRDGERLTLLLAPRDAFTPNAWLNVETTVTGLPSWRPESRAGRERGAWVIELGDEPVALDLIPAAD
jgi:hypothetical protein